MKRALIIVLAAAALVAVVPAGASASVSAHAARSYQAKAVNKANRWAYHRYPSAYYIESECYGTGYRRAECRIELTKAYSSCSVMVTVTGRYHRVRRYDSTC
jgi:hypothetical protein